MTTSASSRASPSPIASQGSSSGKEQRGKEEGVMPRGAKGRQSSKRGRESLQDDATLSLCQ